ncbi:murein hydrolase activator EnvC family protein [Microbacterium sp. P06]|uniref:murein hydrolase activator EnvC family protein n=1 Tax=unclassified Microbacterium TaxID=2609290 RepID=UPI003745B61C
MAQRARWTRAVAAASVFVTLAVSPAATGEAALTTDPSELDWRWPVEPVRIVAAYQAPPHDYGPGHRGIDLAADALDVHAPADGIIAFAGPVAGRGVVTIDHGGGLVTTLEPVAPRVTAGAHVDRGQTVASVASGGHAPPGVLHFGVRLEGEYINPMLLLGGVPRAVLLPCC